MYVLFLCMGAWTEAPVTQHIIFKIIPWKNKGIFDALNDIIDNMKLLQLMDLIGNINRAVSIVRKWIFD